MKNKFKKILTCALVGACITTASVGVALGNKAEPKPVNAYQATLAEPLLNEYEYVERTQNCRLVAYFVEKRLRNIVRYTYVL